MNNNEIESMAGELSYAHDVLKEVQLKCDQLKKQMRSGQIKYLTTDHELATKYGNQVFGLEKIIGRLNKLKTMAMRDQLRILARHTVIGRRAVKPIREVPVKQ